MPAEPIPFGNNLQSGWSAMGGAAPAALNVVIDGRGVVHRRPAITAYTEAPSSPVDAGGISGIYATFGGGLYAVGGTAPNRKLYKVTGGVAGELVGPDNPVLRGPLRPVFAETEALLVIAAGAEIQKVVLDTDISSRLGGNPPNASHIIFNASRLLANDIVVDRSKIRYTSVAIGSVFAGHEDWSFAGVGTAGFFSAEASPDPIEALGTTADEVFAFGGGTLQAFAPDPTFVFAKSSTREFGIAAPYSVIRADQAFAWLDDDRRFVMSDGRQQQDIGEEIRAVVRDIPDVTDCFGYLVRVGFVNALVWTFPSVDLTLAYQVGAGWSQWAQTGTDNAWSPFPVTAAAHRPDNNIVAVGLSDGKVAKLTLGPADDLGENIVAYVRTGYLHRGTESKKWCKSLKLTFESPDVTLDSSVPVGSIRWSDINGIWGDPRPVYLNDHTPRGPTAVLRSLGSYRRRAWQFEFSGPFRLALARAEEDFEVLEV